MSHALDRVAEEIAADEWERKWGSGIYHASSDVQTQARKVALKKVEKWYKLLKPVFEAEENARIRAVDANVDSAIDDMWGATGDATREYLIAQLLDRNGNLPA